MTVFDYSPVIEKVGDWVTQEALSMLYTRYRFAAEFCRGKRLLEVACGEGVGLSFLAKHAAHAVGADITGELLNRGRQVSKGALSLLRLNAEALAFCGASRDVIVCYEAIYYIEQPGRFLRECRRVLAPQGRVLLCTVNPEWPDFNPSLHSRRYYSTQQLASLLKDAGFHAEVFGAFPLAQAAPWIACVSWLKRLAVAWHLIPYTMSGKRLLKRLFLGKLVSFPATLEEGMADYAQPVPIAHNQAITTYKILFAVGRPA